jgi:hypothetical protein
VRAARLNLSFSTSACDGTISFIVVRNHHIGRAAMLLESDKLDRPPQGLPLHRPNSAMPLEAVDLLSIALKRKRYCLH